MLQIIVTLSNLNIKIPRNAVFRQNRKNKMPQNSKIDKKPRKVYLP